MRATRIALILAMSSACGIAMQQAAMAQEYRGTLQQQLACTADVLSLCGDQIPDTQPYRRLPAAKHAAAQ